jgi:hypothetical protein
MSYMVQKKTERMLLIKTKHKKKSETSVPLSLT